MSISWENLPQGDAIASFFGQQFPVTLQPLLSSTEEARAYLGSPKT